MRRVTFFVFACYIFVFQTSFVIYRYYQETFFLIIDYTFCFNLFI